MYINFNSSTIVLNEDIIKAAYRLNNNNEVTRMLHYGTSIKVLQMERALLLYRNKIKFYSYDNRQLKSTNCITALQYK